MIGIPWKEAVQRVEYKLIFEFLLYFTLSSNKPLLCFILSSAKQGVFRHNWMYPLLRKIIFHKNQAGSFRQTGSASLT
jgi:hypothetical protein